jgi:cysteine desulfurase family protein (TIGR01976 family)
MIPNFDHEDVRAAFPGLESPDVLLDNAGGSQLPRQVADRVRAHLLHAYVQLGADYRTSRRAVATVEAARSFCRTLVHAGEAGEVVLGSSTSALAAMLADAHARAPAPGRDEVIVCDAGHEANIGPWVRLAERGHQLRWWRIDPESQECRLADLDALLSERTRLVAVHHVSNLLGRIEDVAEIARRAHAVGAAVVVDGVAFAPHRAVDVQALGADFYLFSTYKVYGPHMAVLFGRHEAWQGLPGPNHFFVPPDAVPYRFELGGVSHEGCAGLLGTRDYLAEVAGVPSEALDRPAVERAFARFAGWEQEPMEAFVGWCRVRTDLRWIGPATAEPAVRVPTLSFVHATRSSREIVQACNRRGLGIRFGHFYAHRLATALGLDPDDGVVRTSLVHYNTVDEVERLCGVLDEVLAGG